MNLSLNRGDPGAPWNFRLENSTDAISDVRLSRNGVRLLDMAAFPGVVEVSSGVRGQVPGFAVLSYTQNGVRVKRWLTVGGPANAPVSVDVNLRIPQ